MSAEGERGMREAGRDTAEGILFTDLYQLTMAQVYYRQGMHETHAQFDHFFRSYPDYGKHKAGYCINAGLEWLVDWMGDARFRDRDLEHLRAQEGATGKRLFDDDFLAWLRSEGNFDGVTMLAILEGRVVHPGVPLTVVRGPLAVAQILESPLLNHLNYPTLVATRAARLKQSGRGRPVLEFGMRRAHGKAANAGARAALIGGADFTSNVGVSCVVGYPPKGTHAHSMIEAFLALGGSELDAFRAYADVYPDDCLLLVDTVDTLHSGLPNAVTVFEELRRAGHRPLGVRLDSGDLAHLSIQAARMLDEAGFADARIVLSNQLDELVLLQILTQIQEEAPRYGVDPDELCGRLVYGIGTRLITSKGDAALDGVYKLVAMRRDGAWVPTVKVSETRAKVPDPGAKRVWRLYDARDKAIADLLSLEEEDPRGMERIGLRHPVDENARRTLAREEVADAESLLVPVLREGRPVEPAPSIETMRRRRDRDLERLDPGVRRIMNPHRYHVSLTERLWKLKRELIESAGRPG